MTHSEINAMSKRELVRLVETIAACAGEAWNHADELAARTDKLFEDEQYEAAHVAQLVWQSFDSALKMANLQGFRNN